MAPNQNNEITTGLADTEFYIKILSGIIKKVNKAKPKDRMNYALEVARCLNGILISVNGWKNWINNLERLHALDIEDYEEVYPVMRKCTVDLLEMDISITKKKLAEVNKLLKEIDKTKGKFNRLKSKKSKSTYVS